MSQIGGKFLLNKNEKFFEHLVALGIPEDRAKLANSFKPILEISVSGNQVTFISSSGEQRSESVLTFDEEVDEVIASQVTVKSITTINGNKINIFSKGPNGATGSRLFEFFEDKLIMTLSSKDRNAPTATRIYDRI